MKDQDISHKIIGAAFEVHNFLGVGFQEVIYQRALAYEFDQAELQFARELEHEIMYKELKNPIGTRRADFIVEQKIMVEIKAKKALDDVDLAQALNYLKIYGYETGLLINFGAKSLEFKRLILTR